MQLISKRLIRRSARKRAAIADRPFYIVDGASMGVYCDEADERELSVFRWWNVMTELSVIIASGVVII